ncbi:MAG: zf-HC2 domain-containing protein [Oscillospiraceae bacterium]|nr:zf-HC2 domain-containing protein [Oscillospiraceae bacterium]
MSRKNCEIIKDLLPLYADGICSEESRKMVTEHIASCDECRKELEMMQTEINIKEQIDTDIKAIKKIRKKIRTGKIIAVILSFIAAYFIFCGLFFGLLGLSNEMKPMNYERNHLSENIYAEEDENGKVWIVRKGYANDGTIDMGLRIHGSGTKVTGFLTGGQGPFSSEDSVSRFESGIRDAKEIDLVITLAETKFEHIMNNTDFLSYDERGLLLSRLALDTELHQSRNLAADTTIETSKLAAIYYYDPETDTEYLLWEKSSKSK